MTVPGSGPSSPTTDPNPTERSERRCRGCRGNAAPRPPILGPEVVIAARDRGREPELPAATVELALAGAMPPARARYDLVVVPEPGTVDALGPLAVEFARHDHRVFWLERRGDAATRYRGPRPPRLVVGATEAPDQPPELLKTLSALRLEHGIEAGLVLGPAAAVSTVARISRRRWGWRAATIEAHPDRPMPRVRLRDDDGEITLPPGATVDLASEPSWPARWARLDGAFRSAWPRATVIVVTFDNLAFTRLCLASLLANTEYPNLEILVVDNASTDGTPEFLRELTTRHQGVRAVFNAANAGFGPANNQGLAAASGDRFVLLNNDTIVPPGWLSRLMLRLDDSAIGMIGPATNRTCNEAQVETTYRTYAELLRFARDRAARFDGETRPIRMLAMFCAAFRRSLYEEIGPLDERYAIGMFEDEDYALMAKAHGYEVAWAPDAYIHHAYHASIGKLLPTGRYLPLFRSNQRKFEHKWGVCWERHRPPA